MVFFAPGIPRGVPVARRNSPTERAAPFPQVVGVAPIVEQQAGDAAAQTPARMHIDAHRRGVIVPGIEMSGSLGEPMPQRIPIRDIIPVGLETLPLQRDATVAEIQPAGAIAGARAVLAPALQLQHDVHLAAPAAQPAPAAPGAALTPGENALIGAAAVGTGVLVGAFSAPLGGLFILSGAVGIATGIIKGIYNACVSST